MTTNNHSTIRFIGYAIPTTPAAMVAIGNPNGPGAVAGTYLGNKDLKADVNARIDVLKNAVETAKAKLDPKEDSAAVTNVFLAPEFFFHGDQGPYVYTDDSDDPVPMMLEALATAFPADTYPNWTIVCGSAITAKVRAIDKLYGENSTQVRNSVVEALSKQWLAAFGPLNGVIFDMLVNFIKNCHSYPNLEVRNRALIVSNIPLDGPGRTLNATTMSTEKYFVSNEDFILYDVTGRPDVVTEQMTAYPMIDLSAGDLKQTVDDQYAVFRQNYGPGNFPNYVDFAIEICLDHSDIRLRRNIESEPFPLPTDAIHVQLIPSCGMQINPPSVAADINGFVFNCDGQYGLDTTNGEAQQGVQSGVACLYVNYINQANSNYAGHTQLARVQAPATGNDPNAKTSTNASFHTLQATDITIVDVPEIAVLKDYFAGGPGQVHIYGHHTPYTLYP